MRTVELGRMSWREAEDALGVDPVVLLPMGTIEQHGPHLPMSADAVVAEHVALEAATRTAALVLPAIPFGYCESSRSFPGTITVSPAALARFLAESLTSLVAHGAKRFIIVNNHRSNEPIVQQVARDLRRENEVIVGSFFPWGEMTEALRRQHPGLSDAIGHGGEPETSVMLQLRPMDVTPGARKGRQEFGSFQGIAMSSAAQGRVGDDLVSLFVDLQEISDTGMRGDGGVGSAHRGLALLESVISKLARFIEAMKGLKVSDV